MMEKAGQTCQVSLWKANASEPSARYRKVTEEIKNDVRSIRHDEYAGNLITVHMVSGIKTARAKGRLCGGTWEPVL